MNTAQLRWIRQRATRLESCQPATPLSHEEQQALDRMVGEARVIAIGEMTHGAKQVFQARERLLRFLIKERGVTALVLEACFVATRRLDEHLLCGEGATVEALACTQFWSCINAETLHLMQWIREHNASPGGRLRPVRVYGCDLQSIDGPKGEVSRLIQELGRAGQLAAQDCVELVAALRGLPSDRELYRSVEPLLSEAASKNPDLAKIAQIQARRLQSMTLVRASAEPLTRRLRDLQRALPYGVSENRFFLERCTRLIEQVVDFHFPDGFALRDRYMAENVSAVRAHLAGARLALLMHNLHVVRTPMSIRGEHFVSTGCHLASELAEDYKAIGSAFHHGSYLAAAGERENESEVAVAHVPHSNAFESFLNEFGEAEGVSDWLLELGQRSSTEASPWPADLEMRIGEAGPQGDYNEAFMPQRPDLQYDGLIFFTETTPISVLPEYFQRASQQG